MRRRFAPLGLLGLVISLLPASPSISRANLLCQFPPVVKERLSVGWNGNDESNPIDGGLSMSADGRYVAFASSADNLVPNDTNAVSDIFVRDLKTCVTERASVPDPSTGQTEANVGSGAASISADGRYVLFQSAATNLDGLPSSGATNIYLRDRVAARTTRVSIGPKGETITTGQSSSGFLSADGSTAVFAANFGTNGAEGDTYVRNLATGLTFALMPNCKLWGSGNYPAAISPDGQYVYLTVDVYWRQWAGTQCDFNETYGEFRLYRYGGPTGLLQVDVPPPDHSIADSSWLSVAAKGDFAVFGGSNYGEGTNIYLRDLSGAGNTLTIAADVGNCGGVSISSDGNYITYMVGGSGQPCRGHVVLRADGSDISACLDYLNKVLAEMSLSDDGSLVSYLDNSSGSTIAYVAPTSNGCPVVHPIPDQTAYVGNELSFTVLATDSDGDPMTYQMCAGPQAATLDPQTGVFKWTPTASDVGDNPVGFSAFDPNGHYSNCVFANINVTEVLLGLGDSIAAGHGLGTPTGYPNDPTSAYPSLLAKSLGFTGFNFAISGACAATRGQDGADPNTPGSWNGEARCDKGHSVLSTELNNANNPIPYKPSIITLTVGADDILFADCIKALVLPVEDPCAEPVFSQHLLAFSNNLNKVLSTLHDRYPVSHVVLTRYYNPLPQGPGPGEDPCQIFRLAAVAKYHVPFAYGTGPAAAFQEDAYLHGELVVSGLNTIIQQRADQWGASTVDLHVPFMGKDLCKQYGPSTSRSWVFAPRGEVDGVFDCPGVPNGCPFRFEIIPKEDCVNNCDGTTEYFGSDPPVQSWHVSFTSDGSPHPTTTGQQHIAGLIRAAVNIS